MLGVETEDGDIVLAVKHNKLVGTELNGPYGRRTWRSEGNADTFLTIDSDEARAELGFVGADGEERLYRVVG